MFPLRCVTAQLIRNCQTAISKFSVQVLVGSSNNQKNITENRKNITGNRKNITGNRKNITGNIAYDVKLFPISPQMINYIFQPST